MIAESYDAVVSGTVLSKRNVQQACPRVAATQYTVEVRDASQDRLVDSRINITIFGGTAADGALVASSSTPQSISEGSDISSMIRILGEEDAFSSLSGLSLAKTESFERGYRHIFGLESADIDEITHFGKLKGRLDAAGRSTNYPDNIRSYFSDLAEGRVTCTTRPSPFSALPSTDQQIARGRERTYARQFEKEMERQRIRSPHLPTSAENPDSHHEKEHVWPPFPENFDGLTRAFTTMSGPSKENPNYGTLEAVARLAWNQFVTEEIVHVAPGNNEWEYGGQVPANEWAGWPSNAILAQQGLQPWEDHIQGRAWSRVWGSHQMIETDIGLNPSRRWTSDLWLYRIGRADATVEVLSHELGHALNLKHPWEELEVDWRSIMNYGRCATPDASVFDISAFVGANAIAPGTNSLALGADTSSRLFPCGAYGSYSEGALMSHMSLTPTTVDEFSYGDFGEVEFELQLRGISRSNYGEALVPGGSTEKLYLGSAPGSCCLNGSGTPGFEFLPLTFDNDLPSLGEEHIAWGSAQTMSLTVPMYPIRYTSNGTRYDLLSTGTLAWPTITDWQSFSWAGKRPVYIRGHSDFRFLSEAMTAFSDIDKVEMLRWDSPTFREATIVIPPGGGVLFKVRPYIAPPPDGESFYVEVNAPENVELSLRRFVENDGSLELTETFNICGLQNTQIFDAGSPQEPLEITSYFQIYFGTHDAIETYGFPTLPEVEISLHQGDADQALFTDRFELVSSPQSFSGASTRNGAECLDRNELDVFQMDDYGRPPSAFSLF
jgi:hypothetical protein